jgi:hypothetical protein
MTIRKYKFNLRCNCNGYNIALPLIVSIPDNIVGSLQNDKYFGYFYDFFNDVINKKYDDIINTTDGFTEDQYDNLIDGEFSEIHKCCIFDDSKVDLFLKQDDNDLLKFKSYQDNRYYH